MCSETDENISRAVSKYCNVAERIYERRHCNVARYVHCLLYDNTNHKRADQWYKHKLDGVMDSDSNMQWDQVVEVKRAVMALIHKDEEETKIIEVAITGNSRITKERHTSHIGDDKGKFWGVCREMGIAVVTGSLGRFSKRVGKHISILELQSGLK